MRDPFDAVIAKETRDLAEARCSDDGDEAWTIVTLLSFVVLLWLTAFVVDNIGGWLVASWANNWIRGATLLGALVVAAFIWSVIDKGSPVLAFGVVLLIAVAAVGFLIKGAMESPPVSSNDWYALAFKACPPIFTFARLKKQYTRESP